jgi:hypothetical protein
VRNRTSFDQRLLARSEIGISKTSFLGLLACGCDKAFGLVLTLRVSTAKRKQGLIKFVRLYPFIALLVLGLAYFLGGFGDKRAAVISQGLIISVLYLFIGLVPLLVIIAFLVLGRAGDLQMKVTASSQHKFLYADAFQLPVENMHGYKLAILTGRVPTLTGLTGDTYRTDSAASCSTNAEHIPPVVDCQCGFYAFKDLKNAKFELSINPGAFLLDVDLFGVGFVYEDGYRAETQVVNRLSAPRRCMRCKVLPAKLFVTTFKLGFGNDTWWQWQARCGVCSSSFKEKDKLSFDQMGEHLEVLVSQVN